MKVKAKHHVNYNGTWHGSGEAFSIKDEDFDAMRDCVSVVDGILSGYGEAAEETNAPAERRGRGRPRKTEN